MRSRWIWAAVGFAAILAAGIAAAIARMADSPPADAPSPQAATGGGRAYYVSVRGSDDNPGSAAEPWRTITSAVARLRPGDTLYVRAGTYFERPTVLASGTPTAPITVQSYPGEVAVIDSGVPEFRAAGNHDWELVDPALGEYRSIRQYPSGNVYAYIDGIPGYINGRPLLVLYRSAEAFRATSDAYVDTSTPFYVGPGVFYDPLDKRIHIRLAKTRDMRAAESRYGRIFDSEKPEPGRYAVILSNAETTLTVGGSHLVFKNLVIHQAKNAIRLSPEAHNVRFDGITAWVGDSAIEADGASIHHITVTRSRIYGDHPYWIFWSDMKDPPAPADLLRSTSIDLRGGTHDWDISLNHIRGSGQDLISTNTNERRIFAHHNRMENCGDDAFELEGARDVGEIRVAGNFISNCLVAVAPGQDSPSFSGPLYVYRNIIVFLRNFPVNRAEGINSWNGGGRFGYEYMFKQHSGNTYIYHNTLVLLNHGGDGVNLVPESPAHSYVANNLAVVVNGRVNGDYPTGPGQIVNGNLYWKVNTADSNPLVSSYDTVPAFSVATGLEREGLGEVGGQGTDPRFVGFALEVVDRTRPVWELRSDSEVFEPSDFLLRQDSPAIGSGITIPPHPRLGPLPDTRTSRDIGALPYGVSSAEYDSFPFVTDRP